jgi:hypothetical protein
MFISKLERIHNNKISKINHNFKIKIMLNKIIFFNQMNLKILNKNLKKELLHQNLPRTQPLRNQILKTKHNNFSKIKRWQRSDLNKIQRKLKNKRKKNLQQSSLKLNKNKIVPFKI